jgi:DNA-binding GntR family transcriptional regulator
MSDEAARDDRPRFDPDAGRPGYLYDKLADYLAELITTGRFGHHKRFPGEQRLAKEYGVSLGTARHAIRRLQARGLVMTVKSKGTFVTYKTGSIGRPA